MIQIGYDYLQTFASKSKKRDMAQIGYDYLRTFASDHGSSGSTPSSSTELPPDRDHMVPVSSHADAYRHSSLSTTSNSKKPKLTKTSGTDYDTYMDHTFTLNCTSGRLPPTVVNKEGPSTSTSPDINKDGSHIPRELKARPHVEDGAGSPNNGLTAASSFCHPGSKANGNRPSSTTR